MDLTPGQTAKWVGLVTVGGIVLTLVIFLAITWWLGDPTNDQEGNQPEPAPASAPLVASYD